MLNSRSRGNGFEPHRCHCVLSLSKNINLSLLLVQPKKTRPLETMPSNPKRLLKNTLWKQCLQIRKDYLEIHILIVLLKYCTVFINYYATNSFISTLFSNYIITTNLRFNNCFTSKTKQQNRKENSVMKDTSII